MANTSVIIILAYFFWLSNTIATSLNEIELETTEDSATQQNTEDPFLANRTDTVQSDLLFANQELWCCKSGTTYTPGLDQCVPNEVSTFYYELFPNYTFPNDGLMDCPEGYVSHSTPDFHLKNGALWIGGKRLESNEFCINRMEEEDYSTSPGNFVARYCVPDPCNKSGCIRKCCPTGTAMVTKYYHDLAPILMCEPYPEQLNLSLLRDPQNEPIDPGSYFIRGGLGMKCGDLGVESPPYDISNFSIDHDGKILFYSEDHPRGKKSDRYCIDNVVANETFNTIALGCFPEQVEDTKGAYLFACLKLFATIFLIATLAVYSLLPKMRNIHGVTVMCYLASMTVMYVFHAILMLVRGSDMPIGLCSTLAISLNFAYIATFSWLNVLCYGVWRMFSSIRSPTHSISIFGKQFLYSSVYGWGIPLIVVVIGQILQHSDVPDHVIKPGFRSKMFCWFNPQRRESLIAYLYGPMIVMIFANIVMFVWAAFNFYRRSVESSKVTNISRKNQRFKVILSLFLLMGVPWTTEIITFMADSSFESALFTDIFNIISPIFIFIIFVCKPSVWKMLKLKFPRISPLFSACEKLGSRIVSSKKSKHHPSPESQSNSNNNSDSSSAASANKTDDQSQTGSTDMERSSSYL